MRALVEKGCIQVLIALIQSPDDAVVEQVIWGLGNLAGDDVEMRDLVLHFNAVPALSQVMERAQRDTFFLRNVTWTSSNLVRGNPPPQIPRIARFIPAFAKVIKENTIDNILVDVCWAISYLSDMGDEALESIIFNRISYRLIELLGHHDIGVVVPCLRTLGNIATGTE